MKKFAALLLTLILALTVFSACAKNTDPATAGTTTANVDNGAAADNGLAYMDDIRATYGNGCYGWFYTANGTGEYVDVSERGHDVRCFFDFDAGPEGSPVALASVRNYDNETEIARFTVQFGSDGSWSIGGATILEVQAATMTHQEVSEYPHLLAITGTVDDGKGTFDYTISLRPWGESWDDVAAAMPENMPEHYDDWYLPLINDGAAMPWQN